MDEAALVSAAQQGDLDAFNRLVLAYQDMAYNLAYRMLSDENAAADATQNAFLSAYKNLRAFRGGSFKAWLLRTVTNACYDELRRRQRRPPLRWNPSAMAMRKSKLPPGWPMTALPLRRRRSGANSREPSNNA